jgi:hypothetical protein
MDATSGVCRWDTPKSAAVVTPQGVANMTLWPTVRLLVDKCSRYEVELVKPARFIPRVGPLESGKN